MKVRIEETEKAVRVVRKHKPRNGKGMTLAEFSRTHGGWPAAELWVARKGHEVVS